jgi:hypothetical protein
LAEAGPLLDKRGLSETAVSLALDQAGGGELVALFEMDEPDALGGAATFADLA